MARILESIDLLLHYGRLGLASQFLFRIDAVLRAVAVFVREFATVAVVLLMLQGFNDIGGWTLAQMVFLFSFLFLTYGILISFFTSFRDFEDLVHRGDLDRFLLRPRGLMFQLVASQADYLATIGQGGVGLVLFVWAAGNVGIEWDIGKVIYLVTSLASGVLVQGAIFVFFSALNLWAVKTGNAFGMIYYNVRRFAIYPMNIFPGFIQGILVVAVPFAFINYFPAKFLLGKVIADGWPDFLPWLSPVIGFVLFGLVLLFWRASLKRYASTGS